MSEAARRAWRRILPVVGLVAGCGADGEPPEPELVEEAPIVPSGIVLRGPASPSGQPFYLYRATDLELIGDSLAIVDNGNDRIVLVDSSLNVVWISGREGAGPGEYQQPYGVAATPDGMVAVDFGNIRFTELDRSGNLVRSFPAPAATRSFGVRSDGAIVAPNRGLTHYAFIMDGAERSPFAERPDTINGAETVGEFRRSALIVVTAGDTVHVLDDLTGELLKYDPAGRLLQRVTLPFAVLDSVHARNQRRREALAKQGIRSLGSNTTKEMNRTGDGRLLVVISAANTVAFLVDPHSYIARRIIIPADQTEWAPLKNASTMVLLGTRLFALQADSVFVYEIDEAR